MTDIQKPTLQVITGGTPKARQFINAMIAGDEEGCVRVFDEIMASQPTITVIEGGKATSSDRDTTGV